MLQRFFNDIIEYRFIKDLLSESNVPNLPCVSVGDWIIQDCDYVYNNHIIHCNVSGFLEHPPVSDLTPLIVGTRIDRRYNRETDTYEDVILTCGDDVVCGRYTGTGEFDYIADLLDSRLTTQNFSRYMSPANYYDSYTHKMLGKYLSYLKSTYDINLFPFYNCFNYLQATDFYIDPNTKKIVKGKTADYKVFLVPVRFNRYYTVAIDSTVPIMLKAVVWNGKDLVKINPNNISTIAQNLTDELSDDVQVVNRTRFTEPFTWSITTNSPLLQSFVDDLYLALQVPTTNDSFILLLDVHYTLTANVKYDSEKIIEQPNFILNSTFRSKLSLLQLNSRVTYAYSSRLIEYLLLNVICSSDEITENIQAVIKDFLHTKSAKSDTEFTSRLREIIYKKSIDKLSSNHLDLNGFVDKSVEYYVMGRDT